MKIHISINRIWSYLFLVMLISAIIIIAYIGKYGLAIQLIIIIIFALIVGFIQFYICKKSNHHSKINIYLAIILCIPTILSCFQNVIYGYFIENINAQQLQIILSLNLIMAGSIYIFFILYRIKFQNLLYKEITLLLFAITGYSFLIWGIFHGDVVSAISSFRNIITPYLMILIGILGGKFIKIKDYSKYIIILAFIVVLFGFYELYIDKNFWLNLNITELWKKKGIGVNYSGFPFNFYSSEIIGGSQIRRMVSTYADPVNLGAFLFAAFTLAFCYKYKLVSLIIFIGNILVISKGALLGYLILFVVWSYYKKGYKIFIPALLFTSCSGIGFLVFASYNSTGSVFLHIKGFIMAFIELRHYPLGRGLGNIGVLAGLFSTGLKSNITESGLGMIIGQLGLVGLLIYIIFWLLLIKSIKKLNEKEDRIVAMVLLISIILNIFFNEVALSPNSCTVYYLAMGIIFGNNMTSHGNLKT